MLHGQDILVPFSCLCHKETSQLSPPRTLNVGFWLRDPRSVLMTGSVPTRGRVHPTARTNIPEPPAYPDDGEN